MSFELNERLAKGGFDFGTLGICRVLLKNNAVFPWFVLVPEVDVSITELHQLNEADYTSVCQITRQISQFVEQHFKADKINTGAIGNIVRQLHIHVIVRHETDPAWPGVVWSSKEKKTYTHEDQLAIHAAYKSYFNGSIGPSKSGL